MVARTRGGMIADGQKILSGFLGVESLVWLSFAFIGVWDKGCTRYPLLEA